VIEKKGVDLAISSMQWGRSIFAAKRGERGICALSLFHKEYLSAAELG